MTAPGGSYLSNREKAFDLCRKALAQKTVFASESCLVIEGDSLELLSRMPEESVNLILTDPPYHSTQKKNIPGDTRFKVDADYLNWIEEFGAKWASLLRKNGSLYVFCSTKLSAHIEVRLTKYFNFLSHVTWTKPNEPGFDGWKGKMRKTNLRAWYPHSERVLFFEPAGNGNLKRSPFGLWLKDERKKAGLSTYDLAEITESYGTVNHGGAVSNWEAGRNVPSREQYAKIIAAFTQKLPKEVFPAYEDAIRPFNAHGEMEFTDTWHYPSVKPYKGKHPAEKPANLLKAVIETSSYPGDVVLDCFAGSGSTGEAAISAGRKAILMEIDRGWCEVVAERVSKIVPSDSVHLPVRHRPLRDQLSILS